VATNDGNVTLSGVTVSDPLLPALVCTPTTPVTLPPGASISCTGTHALSQADLDAGNVINIATTAATTPGGALASATDTVNVPVTSTSHLSLDKSGVVHLSSPPVVGDTIDYTIVATNDGLVTLTGVTVSDPKLPTLVCTPPQPATLAPGATLTCTGTYTLTQADLDAGQVSNTATAGADVFGGSGALSARGDAVLDVRGDQAGTITPPPAPTPAPPVDGQPDPDVAPLPFTGAVIQIPAAVLLGACMIALGAFCASVRRRRHEPHLLRKGRHSA
jgi:hypothetical protein